ncbi:MAG: lamin tail domain-containing protein, partial [Thermoplasmata archaeon]
FVSASPAPSGIAGKTYYWNFTNLAPGSYSITFTARVNESIPPTTTIYNNVSVNYTDILGRKMPESIYSCAILYNAPYIVVGKIVDRETASPGDWLNYTVYYNNTGSANSKYVWINDTLPDHVTFVTSSIPYNSTDGRTYKWVLENVSVGMNALTITVRINTTAPTGITITNSVSLNYTDAAGNKLQNSSASANTSVIGAFALVVINEISSYPNPEWIEIANPTDSSVNIGGWYIYRGATRIYTFPAGTVLGPFGSGSEYLSVTLSNQLPDTGAIITLRRTATEIIDETIYPRMNSGESWARFKHEDTGRPVDTNTSSDFYISSSPTRNAPNDRKAPYIVVAKIANTAETQPGGLITYTIYYNNTGDGNAKEVWINDTLPDGVTFVSSSIPYTSTDGRTYRWYFGTVVHDSQNALTITVRVNDTVPDQTKLLNYVNLDYKDQLRRQMPSSSREVIVLSKRPIIVVEKIVDRETAGYGEILTYTIYYNNTGTGTAGDVWINDTLPEGVDFVSASDGGVLDGNVVRWHFTNVAPGSHYVTLQVSVNVTQGTLTNWAFLNYTSLYGVKFQGSSDSANTTVVPETSWHYSMLGVLVLVTVNVLKRKYGGVKNDKKTRG